MTWRDDLRRVTMADKRQLIGASFRGVPFFVAVADRTGGRRAVVHEFPGRDEPYVEDLGRRARTFAVEGYVLGAGYVGQRDELLAALEDESGPGKLIHPYYGVRRAVCTSLAVREAIADGGMAVLSIEFVEVPGTPTLAEEVEAAAAVAISAPAARLAGAAEFAGGYSISGMPAYSLASAAEVLSTLSDELGARLAPVVSDTQELARLNAEVLSLTGQATSLIREPAGVLGAYQAALDAIAGTIAAAPRKVISALLDTYAVDTGPLALATTATRARELANQRALAAALRRIVVIAAAEIAPSVTFETQEDAEGVRDDIAEALDDLAAEAGDDAYPAIVQLRADLVAAVPGDAVLARLVTVEQRMAAPSIVVAYQIYGSTEREAEIVARNGIRHPGFVTGELEVVSDV